MHSSSIIYKAFIATALILGISKVPMAESIQCEGSESITFSPELTFTNQGTVRMTVNGNLDCSSPDGNKFTGNYREDRIVADGSCPLTLSSQDTRKTIIFWSSGDSSETTFNEGPYGSSTGVITSGRFSNGRVSRNTKYSFDTRDCPAKPVSTGESDVQLTIDLD